MRSGGPDEAAALIGEAMAKASKPVIVALDGRSGVGKSTLAAALADRLGGTVIEGDDFYAGGTGILGDSPQSRAARCIDWRDQVRVLAALKSGIAARYHGFDWDAFDGRKLAQPTIVHPSPLILLEGVYSARPELAELVDLRFLLSVSDEVRLARLLEREGEIGPWETQWHEAEDWYFTHAAPAHGFDLVLDR
jgi:uridine kinase